MTTHGATATGAGADKGRLIATWIAQIIPAAIFIFAGVNKFAAPAMLAEGLGVPTALVYLIGVTELAAAALLLIPKLAVLGAGLGVLIMIGALGSHAVKLGWTGDLGGMWWMALIVLAGCIATLALRKGQAQAMIARVKKQA